jgi:uncharacterized alkaline shock family protein YloU
MSRGNETTPEGVTHITPQAVFSLALHSALNTYGVLGIASRYSQQDVTLRDPHRGIEVKLTHTDDYKTHVTVDIHIISEYGLRLQSVAESVQHQIAYAIEHGTGYSVDAVNVHFAAVRVTNQQS